MVVAKVARIELLEGAWPDLLDQIDQYVKEGSPVATREHALECLGYICEEHVDVADRFPQQETNRMLTSLVQGIASKDQVGVCLAATRALCDALEFASVNFDNESERTYLMQMICEVTISTDARIRNAAYQNLNKVLELHYRYLEPYIATIYGLTTKTFKDADDEVAMQARHAPFRIPALYQSRCSTSLCRVSVASHMRPLLSSPLRAAQPVGRSCGGATQAIEFWSTVAEIETCLQEEDDSAGVSSTDEGECKDFLARSANDLVPLLLELLLMQSEDQDLDDTDWCARRGRLCWVPLFPP